MKKSSFTESQILAVLRQVEVSCLVDLSRFCAAPLITYCAAKEMSHEHRQDG